MDDKTSHFDAGPTIEPAIEARCLLDVPNDGKVPTRLTRGPG